jgi:cellulose synthase/poly-beta-1,6-N-acetylglucosamine synthase-like glycosyltransferase
MALGDCILLGLAAIASLPTVVLACEMLAAIWPRRSRALDPNLARPRCAVLIPAHNEAAGIAATIASLRTQLSDGDRLVVIADNCSDATAEIARREGAEAIERTDLQRRGKGFALEFGLKHLENSPPEIVVLIDADTRAHRDALAWLVGDAQRRQAPVQGVFTDAPRSGGPREQWSAFALTFKNLVRPLGLHRLGLPCLLCGSGMAFPWPVIRKAELGTGNIVEDMKLGIDLARAGHPPRFCVEARFESDEAPNLLSAAKRRTRWEHGHVITILTQAPRLMLTGALTLRPRLAALALELAVPPMSLLVLVQAVVVAICLISWQLGGSVLPLLIMTGGLFLAAVTILTAWLFFGRRLISPKFLCLLPFYVLWKVPIYLKLMVAPQRSWVRTERNPAS